MWKLYDNINEWISGVRRKFYPIQNKFEIFVLGLAKRYAVDFTATMARSMAKMLLFWV